jgi:hypothetical protein
MCNNVVLTIVIWKSNIYFHCVLVAFFIQQAKRMRHIIVSSVVCLAVLYFPTLSQKRHDFQKES